LTIQPVAPAALPSSFFPAWDSVVSMMMGTNLYPAVARTARISSMPSMLGMFRSVTIMSTGPVSLARASLPSQASMTEYPASFRVRLTICRTLAESSTVIIVLLMSCPRFCW